MATGGRQGPRLLEGTRVLELSSERTAYCGRLLSDLGAEVVLVEHPSVNRVRAAEPRAPDGESLAHLYLNAGKRSLAVDLHEEKGIETLQRLAAAADVLIDGVGARSLHDRLLAANERLVLASITDFGLTGPWRHYRGGDLVVSALSGAMTVTGHPDDPPVRLAGAQAYAMCGATAAASAQIALRHARATGQGQLIDISAQEVMVSVSHISGIGKYLADGIVSERSGTALVASVPSGAYACSDGLVYLTVNRPLHWKALAKWVHEVTGNGEILDPMFEGPSANRIEYRDLLDIFIGELAATLTVEEAYREGQRRHLAMTPVSGAARVLEDRHLGETGFFQDTNTGGSVVKVPGPPYRISGEPPARREPAPALGEAAASDFEKRPRDSKHVGATALTAKRPLEGIRVVEFTAGLAGPWVGRFMAWCGADVIKVESRGFPDVTRMYVPPRDPEAGVQSTTSPWFTDWNAGKRFVSLDLTRAEGVDAAKAVVAKADVVVANFACGVMEKLGLGYRALREAKPDLVMISSTGFGDTGDCARYVTWGPNIEAVSGLASLSGFPHRDCTLTQYAYPDPASALHGLCVVLAALDDRDRRGEGRYISLSQYETTAALVGVELMESGLAKAARPRIGNRAQDAAPHGCYPCSGNDGWIAIAATDDTQWKTLCAELLGAETASDRRFSTLAGRLENADALDALVAEKTAGCNAQDLMRRLQACGIPAGAAQTVSDLLHVDPQLRDRGFFESIEHATLGEVRATGIPLGLTGTPGKTDGSGHAMGAHNEEVFSGLAGIDAGRYEELVEAGVIES